MKLKRVLSYVLTHVLFMCVLSFSAYAQNVQTTDERITPPSPADRVCVAAQKAGADIGAKVNACDASLGAAKGEIWLTGGGTISTPIVISSNHTLRVMSGDYPATTNGAVIRLKDHSALMCDSWAPTLQESTGTFNISSPFTVVSAYNGASLDSLNGAPAQNIIIRGCHFKGAREDFHSAPPAVVTGNCKDCQVMNNWLESTNSIGIQVGGGISNGHYAQNVLVSGNLLTAVASQNIAVTNAEGVIITGNTMKNPGQTGGPGLTVIDVEPNFFDHTKSIKIHGNLIDTTGSPIAPTASYVTNGIVVQNANQANPFGHIEVSSNTIIGTDHSNANYNGISYAGIMVLTATDVRIADNYVRRAARGIVIAGDSSGITVERNTLATCGSPSGYPFSVEDSSNNKILNNVLYNQPGDALGYSDNLVRSIVETGTSNNNIYSGNYAVATLAGSGSRIIYEHTGTTSFDFRSPAGTAPFTVTSGAAKVSNLDADKLDGQEGSFYQNASNLNAGVAAPARLGTGTPSSSNFLRGDGVWAAPSGSGDGGWTDDGTVVRLTTATDYVGIGTGAPGSKLTVSDGNVHVLTTSLVSGGVIGDIGFGPGGVYSAVQPRAFMRGYFQGPLWYNGSALAFFTHGGGDITANNNVAERMRIDKDGNIGVGTSTPTAKLQVTDGDIYVSTVGKGIILKSPNGSCFRVTVSDAGALGTAGVTCP
jgi:hypothetical protein